MATRGSIFVVSGPSGVGKHTILRRLEERDPDLEHTVSATSRRPRRGEVPGKDYYFLDKDEFRRRVEAGDFVEWAEVHDSLYGTLREELERHVRSGKDVILQLDVQGARNLKAALPQVTLVFIMPPSFEELERRIRRRASDDAEAVAVRLRNARAEMDARFEYDHVVVNETVETAVAECEAIIRRRRLAAAGQP